MKRFFKYFSKIYFLLFLAFSLDVLAYVTPQFLSSETLNRFELVPEFAFIKEEAEKLGVKVYLFGGTASAFAHYMRWDLERETGDTKYQAERFDYDFTNIYRGNQDLDIVVDGTAGQAQALRKILQQTYPHFMGEREAWEVRLLREPLGDKLPLLDDYDFKNQHTDTNSTGMLALNPVAGEIVYRDLLDWENPESKFLTDVAAAKIKFLYNDKHETTSRFKEGKNPPILAAIRYLAKLTQYEVEGTPEDLETVKQIISKTQKEDFNDYIKNKASEFSLKALLNAPDVEYAWNLLEETGARKLLMEIDGNKISEVKSLSWWFNKEPLKSFKLGRGEGETAKEIFESDEIILAHETNSFIAYENITRSAKGGANVFISRDEIIGEFAVYGDGFYTKVGNEGARETGLTVRFKLHPSAREGTDFIKQDDFIIIQNKNALTLIQENLNISIVDYLKLLELNEITNKDKGLIAKFNRKFGRMKKDSQQFQDAVDYLKESLFISEKIPQSLRFDFSSIQFENFEDLISFSTNERKNYPTQLATKLATPYPYNNVLELEETITLLIELGSIDEEIIEHTLGNESNPAPRWIKHTEWIDALLEKNNPQLDKKITNHIIFNKAWQTTSHWMKWVDTLFRRDHINTNIFLVQLLQNPYWEDKHDEWFSILLDIGNRDILLELIYMNKLGNLRLKPSWVKGIIDKNHIEFDRALVHSILPRKEWTHFPYLVEALLKRNNPSLMPDIFKKVLSQPDWWPVISPQWINYLLAINDLEIDKLIAQYVLSRGFAAKHPEWMETLLDRDNDVINEHLAMFAFPWPHWGDRPDFAMKLIDKNTFREAHATHFLEYEHWAQYPELLYKLLDFNDHEADGYINRTILKRTAWRKKLSTRAYVFALKLTADDVRKKRSSRWSFIESKQSFLRSKPTPPPSPVPSCQSLLSY